MEMVDSVDDLKSPRSSQSYTHFPNFEMLDARIASATSRRILFTKLRESHDTIQKQDT